MRKIRSSTSNALYHGHTVSITKNKGGARQVVTAKRSDLGNDEWRKEYVVIIGDVPYYFPCSGFAASFLIKYCGGNRVWDALPESEKDTRSDNYPWIS